MSTPDKKFYSSKPRYVPQVNRYVHDIAENEGRKTGYHLRLQSKIIIIIYLLITRYSW